MSEVKAIYDGKKYDIVDEIMRGRLDIDPMEEVEGICTDIQYESRRIAREIEYIDIDDIRRELAYEQEIDEDDVSDEDIRLKVQEMVEEAIG